MTHVHASQVFPVLLLALAPTATSFAQALDQDFCRPVLDIGAREESFTRLAWQSAQHLYDNACSKDQVKKDVNASAGFFSSLIGVAKKVVNLNFGSSDDQLHEFCRTYETQSSASLASEQAIRSVNERALDNWLRCREIERQRISIRPHASQKTAVAFDIQRKGGAVAAVNGVTYDPKLLTCEVRDPTGADSQRRWRKIAPDWGGQTLSDDQEVQIKCVRHGFPKSGGTVRPEADISVHTSAGTLPITLPKDVSLPDSSAAEIAAKLRELDAVVARSIRSFELTAEVESQLPAQGTPPKVASKSLGVNTNEGICFLTLVSGNLLGFGEYAAVRPENNIWTLHVSAGTGTTMARASCVRFRRASASPSK